MFGTPSEFGSPRCIWLAQTALDLYASMARPLYMKLFLLVSGSPLLYDANREVWLVHAFWFSQRSWLALVLGCSLTVWLALRRWYSLKFLVRPLFMVLA